jgi:hypothetical protein
MQFMASIEKSEKAATTVLTAYVKVNRKLNASSGDARN